MTLQANKSSKKPKRQAAPWAARTASVLLGVIFLAAGAAKGVDIEEAVRQAGAYDVIGDRNVLLILVWMLIGAECALGAALILFYRVRTALAGVAALMAVFLAALFYAWAAGVTEDCGCFGQWASRTPGQALVEDLVLLVLLAAAWFGIPPQPRRPARLRASLAAAAAIAGLLLPLAAGFSFRSVPVPGVQAPPAPSVQTADGRPLDWGEDAVLVELMSTDCQHCMDAVMNLNAMALAPGMPRIMGLTLDDPERIDEFARLMLPEYPILQLVDEDFWKLVGVGSVPRFLLIRKGRLAAAWEIHPPDPETLRSILESTA